MAYQPYGSAPSMEPPEAQSVRSMLHIARIIALIFGILLFLGGLAYAALLAVAGLLILAFVPVLLIIWGVVDFIIYMQCREIESMVNSRQYEAAKSKTLVWMIIGFIIGGILVGIFLLIAYLKFDPLINWQRSQGGAGVPPAQPVMAAPVAAAPPVAPAPAAAPAPGGATPPNCPTCGKPTTYISQYGRYYCYSCSKYV
jgi:hypothetical protein